MPIDFDSKTPLCLPALPEHRPQSVPTLAQILRRGGIATRLATIACVLHSLEAERHAPLRSAILHHEMPVVETTVLGQDGGQDA